MKVDFYITCLIPILIVLAQYPLFMELIIFNKRRNELLKSIMIINAIASMAAFVIYTIDKLQWGVWIAIELLVINIIYSIYNVFFKENISRIFDSDYIEDKDSYIEFMTKYIEKYKSMIFILKIGMFVYALIYLSIMKYVSVSYIKYVVLQEILLILNYFIWKKGYTVFNNEKIRLEK